MNYLLQCANMHTYTLQHTYCAHSVSLMLYVLPAVSMHLLALTYAVILFILFPVWCSALVLTNCQSNALTPSICSIVTTSMDVMSYVYGCKLWCYLFVVTCIAVISVLSVYVHTVHSHCQVFWVCLTYNNNVLYTYFMWQLLLSLWHIHVCGL